MRRDLVEALVAACPQAFRDLGGDPMQTAMARGVECGDGWFNILLALCNAVQHELDAHPDPEFHFTQVKQKLGDLRIYHNGTGNASIQNLLYRARAESRTTCEACGTSPAVIRTIRGWLQCLCAACERRVTRPT